MMRAQEKEATTNQEDHDDCIEVFSLIAMKMTFDYKIYFFIMYVSMSFGPEM